MSLFLQFAELNDALAATTKKLEKRALIADYLRTIPIEDAGRAALWLSGTPFAETDRRTLNIGGSLLSKAIAQLAATNPAALSAAYRRHGDIGAAAADLLAHGKQGHALDQPTLTLADVEAAFTALAAARGPAPKLRLLLDLLARATPVEAKYLIKLATGDMRTGVQQSLVEEAIAAAWPPPAESTQSGSPSKGLPAAREVRRASMLLGDLRQVVALAAAGQIDQARMNLFHPLGFMLASPVASTAEALSRFTKEIVSEKTNVILSEDRAAIVVEGPAVSSALRAAQLEDKFDGIRAQLHIQNSRAALYSRNREDLSASFPELTEAFATINESAILDGEILAWNPATHRALPFSALQQRLGRKRVPLALRREVPVVLIVFDILYRDGELLLEQPLAERRRHLEEFAARWSSATAASHSNSQPNLFESQTEQAYPRLIVANATRLSTAAQLDQAYTDARARGNEGVMIKSLASPYQPGRRGLAWLKLKRELATLDVVVTAVEFGNGRRARVLSDYTFAIRDTDAIDSADPEAPVYKNVGKAYSGLSDQEIANLTTWFKAHTLQDNGHFRTVEPTIVLEVAFNNVMRSTRHASGFALRFPRILRIRTDKPVEEIDTLARVEEIYNTQPDKPIDPYSPS
ncbi:MAG: ATP-dependent DNA ligase [Acidobacteriaceae bacterium]